MLVITKESHRNNGVEVDNNSTLWLNEEKLGHSNLPVITRKYNLDYRKYKFEICIFMTTNLQQKLMNLVNAIEILTFKYNEKRQQKRDLVMSLFIIISSDEKVFNIFKVINKGTLKNHLLKVFNKQDFTKAIRIGI